MTIRSAVLCAALFFGLTTSSKVMAAEPEPSSDRSGSYAEVASEGPHEDGWEFDTYYIFPLTRHMSDSGLPYGGQIALYPLAFALDLVQWPVGVLAGLAGK